MWNVKLTMIACSAGYAGAMHGFHVTWHTVLLAVGSDIFIANVGNHISYFKESAMIVWSGQAQTEEPLQGFWAPEGHDSARTELGFTTTP